MSGRIPKHFIDDLLARVDIVDLIDTHVPLKKTGANYVARCPFHNEKTPSFSVSRTKQLFKCFGCGASGNSISFLMDFNNLDFIEAVEDLANFAGVEVIRETSGYRKDIAVDETSGDLYGLLEQVAVFYESHLRTSEAGKTAVAYLKSRGIGDELAKTFMLGYAPNEWRALADRFDHKLLIKAGMLVEKDGKVYDRFRGRIMYPIRDKRGRVVGFGGRVLDESLPKYLNSPETGIFHKSNEVYGLYELLRKESKPKQILIVEGYLDVISLVGAGVHCAVATLGTATSQAHLDLLFRFSSELVFCFDGDNAGRQAAWRAVERAFSVVKDTKHVRIMLLPVGHDPDSLVREEGVEGFAERLRQSQALSDYFFNTLTSGVNIGEKEGRSQLAANAEPYLKKLSQGAFRDMMFAQLNALARPDLLDNPANQAKIKQQSIDQRGQDTRLLPLPRRIAALLIQYPELIALVEQKEILWEGMSFPGLELFKGIFHDVRGIKPANTAVLMEHYRNHPNEKAIKHLASLELFVKDQEIDASAVAAEFSDALDKWLDQAKKEAVFQKLIAEDKNRVRH